MGRASVYIPENGQEDFQVQSQAGYNYPYYGEHIMPLYNAFASLGESGWSNTQTVTIGGASTSTPNPTATSTQNPTPTPTQNATPTVPEFPSWIILLFTVIILSTGLLVYFKKYQRRN